MKLKNLTMAIMVASLGTASFAAQADSSWYGSVRAGIQYTDDGTNDETKFRNFASRMGFKGETDLENGMTAFGKYEFSVGLDPSDGDSGVGTRHAYVGLKGGFGKVLIGNTDHTFSSTVNHTNNNWWDGCFGCMGLSRTGEALTWSNSMGNVGVSATAYLGDDQHGDGFELGGSFGAGPVKLGIAVQDTDANDEPLFGISGKGNAGPMEYALAFFSQDGVGDGVDLWLKYNKVYLSVGKKDLDSGLEPSGINLGYTHNIGPKTLMWFEATSSDSDVAGDDNDVSLKAALKYDF